jgi:hypothetical protein
MRPLLFFPWLDVSSCRPAALISWHETQKASREVPRTAEAPSHTKTRAEQKPASHAMRLSLENRRMMLKRSSP